MKCTKCKAEMKRKRSVNKEVTGLEPAQFTCRCGYIIDEKTGEGRWEE